MTTTNDLPPLLSLLSQPCPKTLVGILSTFLFPSSAMATPPVVEISFYSSVELVFFLGFVQS